MSKFDMKIPPIAVVGHSEPDTNTNEPNVRRKQPLKRKEIHYKLVIKQQNRKKITTFTDKTRIRAP